MASSTTLQFYLARAEQAREDAEAATLAHVRERCRRSQDAWTQLAERAQRSEKLRILEADKKALDASTAAEAMGAA